MNVVPVHCLSRFLCFFLNRVQRFSHTIHIIYAGKTHTKTLIKYICIWIRPSLKSKMIFISHSVLKLIYYVLSLQNNPFVMAFPFNLCSNFKMNNKVKRRRRNKTFKYIQFQL